MGLLRPSDRPGSGIAFSPMKTGLAAFLYFSALVEVRQRFTAFSRFLIFYALGELIQLLSSLINAFLHTSSAF
jgi:hypothetical protein